VIVRDIMKDHIKKNLIAQKHQIDEEQDRLSKLEDDAKKVEGELGRAKKQSSRVKKLLEKQGYKLNPNKSKQSEDKKRSITNTTTSMTYEEITKENIEYLAANNLEDTEFDSLFSDEYLDELEAQLSSPIIREKWDKYDYIAVLSAGIAGTVADFFTKGLDEALSEWLSGFKIDSPKVSIDYQGPGFGGPYHRGMSSGHDILRIFSALWQIKNGTFSGLKQATSGFEWVEATENQFGNTFENYGGFESLLIWIRHLLSDFVTPNSLPFPGMSFLMEMQDHEVRKFAIQLYQNGYNLRYIMVQAFAPALVEIIIRSYVMGREYQETRQIKFPSAKKLKTTELLLCSHAMVTAVNAGKVIIKCNAEGPLALRDLNIPSIIMTVRYLIPFVAKRMRLNDPVEILKRNAVEIMENYDNLSTQFNSSLELDVDFQKFLANDEKIYI
jgi:hypothetical protein